MSSNRRSNTFLLFAVALISIVLVVWIITGQSPVPTDPELVRRTPQECVDNYRAMPSNIKAQWSNSEEYMNECTQ